MSAPSREPGENGRLTLAVPAKGRMAEPALRLCADAGLSFEVTERSLVVPCANAPVDLLLVRPSDIPEYVQDGVVDLGITGANLVAEAEAEVVDAGRARLRALHARRRRSGRLAAAERSPTSTACASRPRIPSRRGGCSRERGRRRASSSRSRGSVEADAAARARGRDRRSRLDRARR